MANLVRDRIFLVLKGMAMGAADLIPGVSGGTIAFISGIYEELLSSIKSVDLKAVKVLTKEGIKPFWAHINGWFLVFLFGGIGISLVSLSRVIKFLLETQPVLLWAFFFGLVVSSVIFVGRQVQSWGVGPVIGLVIGAVVAFAVTILPPMGSSGELWFVFVCGIIAICAMILPGISGSFILLLLGAYQGILSALTDGKFEVLAVFGAGCVIGLAAFSRVLTWMFKRFHDITIATLTGFLIGSLNKLWPWKEKVELLYTHRDGKEDWLESNVLPGAFAGEPQVLLVALFAVIGFIIIFVMERVAAQKPAVR